MLSLLYHVAIVQENEITHVERQDGPLLGGGMSQLLLISSRDSPQFLCTGDIKAVPAQFRGQARRQVLIQMELDGVTRIHGSDVLTSMRSCSPGGYDQPPLCCRDNKPTH